MLGKQPGDAILQNAAHGVERSKDNDSISGVCGIDGRLQGQHGGFEQGRRDVFADVLGEPSGLRQVIAQLCQVRLPSANGRRASSLGR